MDRRNQITTALRRTGLWLLAACLTASLAASCAAQSNQSANSVAAANPVVLSRALIEQQIRGEDIEAIEPSQDEVNARLAQIRQQLPACVHQNCATDAGWKLFLAAHGLTSERVESYLRYRLEILSFIEQRFRQGIQVSPQQIDEYYHQTLVPQYKPGETIPQLDQVAPRIQEILLEQQVNVLFDAWLTNLRGQGDVEILDPSLEPTPTQASTPVSGPGASSGVKP
jgi:hypothetical protein